MTICGIAVYHKSFGNGIISSYENTALTVAFSLPDGSEQVKKFVFPDAFTKKYLISSDPRIDEYIQKYIKERTCNVCGKESTLISEVDGKRLCNSCSEKHTKDCAYCKQKHLKDDFCSVSIPEYPYYVSMCKNCFSRLVRKCDNCHVSFITDSPIHSYNGKVYCNRCYQRKICTCDICGEEYFESQGKELYNNGEYLDVCPKCVEEKTFVCVECERHVLKEHLVDSKYIPAEKQICSGCVEYCSSCGEAIDAKHFCTYFGNTYCEDCEATKKLECPICGDEFIPDEVNQTLCPDCVDATEYMELTQKLDFSSRQAKVMSVYDLDNMDRCKLFTDLYVSCRSLEKDSIWKNDELVNPYHYLIMCIIGHQAVVTYLPKNISSKIRCSANVTMTELRSRKGRFSVHTAIDKWLPESNQILHISEGDVHLLHYPVLIRAQTEYDKIYGKEWNGPDDYIEIGNYGDTTEFYIIGVLK